MNLLLIQVSEFPLLPLASILNFTCTSRKISPNFRASIPFNTPSSPALSSSSSSSSTPISVSENPSIEHSLTVRYLIKSCGLPPESAISVSKRIKIFSQEQGHAVLSFFREHGFTKTQISNLVFKLPRVFCCDIGKTLSPKLEFLSSIGLSRTEVTELVSAQPYILQRSLKNFIIPTFQLLTSLLASHEDAVNMVKQYPNLWVHGNDVHCLEILREMGVPDQNIAVSLTYPCRGRVISTEDFRRMVEEVIEMGFDPSTMKFLEAIRLLRSTKKSSWEHKVELFKNWGWSEDDILLAFQRMPWFIRTSADKITSVMNFLVNEMGLEAYAIARIPAVFILSFEKRIIPRSLVYKVLLENNLLRQKKKKTISLYSFNTMLGLSENRYLDWLKTYEEKTPGLLKLYQEILVITK